MTGLPDDVRIHDLRHSYASFLAGSGATLLMIGKLLGHTQAATTQRYAHLTEAPLRRFNDQAGHTLSAAIKVGLATPPPPMLAEPLA